MAVGRVPRTYRPCSAIKPRTLAPSRCPHLVLRLCSSRIAHRRERATQPLRHSLHQSSPRLDTRRLSTQQCSLRLTVTTRRAAISFGKRAKESSAPLARDTSSLGRSFYSARWQGWRCSCGDGSVHQRYAAVSDKCAALWQPRRSCDRPWISYLNSHNLDTSVTPLIGTLVP